MGHSAIFRTNADLPETGGNQCLFDLIFWYTLGLSPWCCIFSPTSVPLRVIKGYQGFLKVSALVLDESLQNKRHGFKSLIQQTQQMPSYDILQIHKSSWRWPNTPWSHKRIGVGE